MPKIDALDQKILESISTNSRISFKEIADACNVSRAAIHQRVLHLIEAGIISNSTYLVNPKSLGYNTCTYIGVKLDRPSRYEIVSKELEKIPEIVECHFTTGPYTILIKLYSHDNEHLMQLLNGQIQQIDGVTSTETLISLAESFHRTVPIILAEEVKKKPKKSRNTRKTSNTEEETDN